MKRFRSWNEYDEKFYYWKKGKYSWTVRGQGTNCMYLGIFNNESECSHFNWENAEQMLIEDDRENEEIYENDKVKCTFTHVTIEGMKTETIEGIAGSDIYGVYINSNNKKYHISDMISSMEIKLKTIGNIHEEVDNKENCI